MADDVLDLATEPGQTARALFNRITALFTENKESRAVFLSQQFSSMVQGDLTINDYCQQMKVLADSLRDVGYTVATPQLVLNLLRGLNPRFSNTADDLANTFPLPSFDWARSMLTIKDLRLANEAQTVSQTAMVATTPPTSCGAGGCRSQAGAPPTGQSSTTTPLGSSQ